MIVIAHISGRSQDVFGQAIQKIMASIPDKDHAGRIIETVGELYANQFDHKDENPAQIEIKLNPETKAITVIAVGCNSLERIQTLDRKLRALHSQDRETYLSSNSCFDGGHGLQYIMRNIMVGKTDESCNFQYHVEGNAYFIEIELLV